MGRSSSMQQCTEQACDESTQTEMADIHTHEKNILFLLFYLNATGISRVGIKNAHVRSGGGPPLPDHKHF